MLTQAEEEIEAAPDRQEVTTSRVMVKKRKRKNSFFKSLTLVKSEMRVQK